MASGMSLGESFESVLAAAQSGAEWAFSVLYRDLNPRLLRYFASRVPGEAEDLAIETWMGAARRIGDFRGNQQQFRAWIFTIAHARLVQHCVTSAGPLSPRRTRALSLTGLRQRTSRAESSTRWPGSKRAGRSSASSASIRPR